MSITQLNFFDYCFEFKKKVQLNEYTVQEISEKCDVYLQCKKCKQTLGDRREFESLNKLWKINVADLDWDVTVTVENKKVICLCGKKIGKFKRIHQIKFYKSAIHIAVVQRQITTNEIPDWE